ncbi:hypothetical protein K435DRAFT_806352 [Dendrothele bispora CBS 962.96]|uniref:MYND-type domain-containing protein n=1 Tax=Dendrothele bispora (strain CBS 962.96) TaxID=1314807 RepID=A0A4S8L868_DENBC|nr:hypothetical protein K435DRAFT_806352 [Dendrothele bispora CBS 962.96]
MATSFFVWFFRLLTISSAFPSSNFSMPRKSTGGRRKKDKDSERIRDATKDIFRLLRFNPPSFVVPTRLIPKAKDALLSLTTLLELLESNRKSQYFVEILSRLQVDWRSLWSWLSVFIKSYANLEMETNSEDNNDSDDLELRAFTLTKLFRILFHVLNPVNTLELPSSREDVYPSRFKSLLHGSCGFYALLVDAIAFGSVNANNVYFAVMDVLCSLLSGEPEDAASDCFVAAISTSPYSKQMPGFFLSPLLIEFGKQASSIDPRRLFLSSFALRFLALGSPTYLEVFWSKSSVSLVHELLRRLLKSLNLEQLSQNVRSAEYLSQHPGSHPTEHVMTFSNTLAHLIEVLAAYMQRIDRCVFLLQTGVISTLLQAQYFINGPGLQSFLIADTRYILEQFIAQCLEIIREMMIFRSVSRQTMRSVRNLIRSGKETELLADEVVVFHGPLWSVWTELRGLATEDGPISQRNTIEAYWKEMVQCSSPQCATRYYPQRLCSQCMVETYCSRTCQKAHWPAHRDECRAIAADQKKGKPMTMSKIDHAFLRATVKFDILHTFTSSIINFEIETFRRGNGLRPCVLIDYRDRPPKVVLEQKPFNMKWTTRTLIKALFPFGVEVTMLL